MGHLKDWTERRGECLVWTHALHSAGYGVMTINSKVLYVHRLAWEEVHGPIPEGLQVDHICFNRACVEPAHLRLVSNKQNMEHLQGAQKNSTTGVRNVFLTNKPGRKKYRAQLTHNYKPVPLGYFDTIEEASAAAVAGRALYFTHAD